MARAIAVAFLVTAAVAAAIVLIGAVGAFSDAPPALLLAAPIVLGLLAAWLLPGTWPDRERGRWSVGVGILVVVAAACGFILGGIVGVYLAFATGVFVIGY